MMNEERLPSTAELVAMLRRDTAYLVDMAKGMEIAWDPRVGRSASRAQRVCAQSRYVLRQQILGAF